MSSSALTATICAQFPPSLSSGDVQSRGVGDESGLTNTADEMSCFTSLTVIIIADQFLSQPYAFDTSWKSLSQRPPYLLAVSFRPFHLQHTQLPVCSSSKALQTRAASLFFTSLYICAIFSCVNAITRIHYSCALSTIRLFRV